MPVTSGPKGHVCRHTRGKGSWVINAMAKRRSHVCTEKPGSTAWRHVAPGEGGREEWDLT